MVSRYCSEAAEPEGRLQGVGQLECIMELQVVGLRMQSPSSIDKERFRASFVSVRCCKRQICLHLAIGEIIFDIPLSQEKAQLKSVARGLQISPRRSRQREVAEHILISVVASRKLKGIQGTPLLLESSKLDDARKTVVKGETRTKYKRRMVLQNSTSEEKKNEME
ncbi:hypothetical protein Tco_0955460 [Tanacetum coccineum]|uniref:Uncharacterized protein n=1 Tax=Tanacetum coccineum TaxID=301880 RepID=A0ABQ5E7B0_9ASTR